MNRRQFLEICAGTTATLLLSGPGALAKRLRKPNIIIIMADDLGYGDLGCYGSEAIATPSIDRLARGGVKLTSFFSSGPVCSPSRAGLLTGRYPPRTGVPYVFFPSENPLVTIPLHTYFRLPPGMDTDEITLGQAIKSAGYATGCIGKWHLGDKEKYRPHHRGFDYYFGLLYSNDMTPLKLYRNDEVVEQHPVDQNYLTRKYTEEALGFIKENRDRPFFLYLAHTFPHIPLHASPEFRGRSRGGLYGDSVEEIDWSTGQILSTLDKYGIAGETFIFFTSDNGPWFQGSPGGFRGRKSATFDGGMRVPGIARWPGVIPAGRVSDEIAMNFDLFTTALAIAGIKPPGDRPIDGKNILPMLEGEKSPHEALFFYLGRDLQAVRVGKWKYHRPHRFWAAYAWYFFISQGPMLFNLETDPDESYDVIDLYPEKARELEQLMADWEANFVKGIPK